MSQLTSREFPRHAWAQARHGLRSWVEPLTDSEFLWRALRPGLLACVVGMMAGPLVVVVLNWRAISEYGRPSATAAPPLAAENASTAAASTSLPLASASTAVSSVAAATLTTPALPTATSVPIVAVPVAATATSVVAPTATSVVDAVAATPSQTAITETAEAAWQALQPDLESAWGTDTPRTLAMLDDFAARFPAFAPAREKLYAALIANADNLTQDGAALDAVDSLNRAASVLPERPEAHAALLSLTPTPTSAPVPPDQVVSVPPSSTGPAVRQAAASVARPPAQPRTVPAPILPPRSPATPTKAPFRPPAAP